MTRFQELAEKGRKLKPSEAQEYVRQLARDERFAALLELLRQQQDWFTSTGSDPRLGDSPGKQAHAWGSVFGLRALEGQLRTFIDGSVGGSGIEPPSE